LDLSNDANGVRPEIAGIVFSEAFAGSTIGLTREAARDNIHESAPGISVKRSRVIPNGEWIKHSVVLSLHEHAPAVAVDFNGANGAPSDETARQQASSSAREQ